MTSQPVKSEGLKRQLSVVDIAASVLNITVGSGIFLLPALVAAILGPASIIAYLVCGALYFCIMLCFAEMSSRVTSSGGAYVYIEKAFGPFAGFIANNLFWLSGVLISAALVNGIADMLSASFPVFERLWWRMLFFALLIGCTCYINITGVKQSMRTAKALVVMKLAPLLLIVIVGLLGLHLSNLTWNELPDVNDLGAASLLLFAAFIGGESAASFGGEMKNPRRTGPLGLLVGVASVIGFYMLIQVVAQSALGNSLATQKAPLATVAGIELGSWAITLLLAAGIISIFGTLFSCVMAFSRVMFAGAFNNLLPSYLGRVHPRFATPHWAIVTVSVLAFILASSGGYRHLIVVATISMMLSYLGVSLALIKFKLKKAAVPSEGFSTPGGITIPLISVLALCWFLWHSKSDEVIGIAIFIMLLMVIYVVKNFVTKKNNQQSYLTEPEQFN